MRWRRLFVATLACVLIGVVELPASGADGEPPNTGLPRSRCAASSEGAKFTAPDRGVTTTGLGSGAPAYYEVGAPSGLFTGRRAKAIMIVIHPGGWYRVGKEVVAVDGRPMADRWRNAGWQTVNIDYRPCAQSIGDVLWFMRRIRQLHADTVICATGSSAGGHLAMLLATMRPDLACAISHAGPTDLLALDGTLANVAVAAFGAKPSPLVNSSPRQHAAKIRARVLLATGRTDPLIPRTQDASFAKTLRATRPAGYVDVMSLPPGESWFVHTGVSPASLLAFRVREDALVAPLLR